jgi:hypothetical protein
MPEGMSKNIGAILRKLGHPGHAFSIYMYTSIIDVLKQVVIIITHYQLHAGYLQLHT